MFQPGQLRAKLQHNTGSQETHHPDMHVRRPIIYELQDARESELKSELLGLRADYEK